MAKKELIQNTSLKPLLNPTVTPLSAGTATTLWLERKEFMSLVVGLATGAASGSPTAQSVTITIQDATDASGTGAANLVDINGDAITVALTGDDENTLANVDLEGAREYVGASVVVAFTGGTTPAIPINVYAAFGDPRDTRNL